MSNTLTYQLFQLIYSLTKAEKRHFKLFATRNSSVKDLKFLKLFDVLDNLETYDEIRLSKRLPDFTPTQLSNAKAHLYEQLLVSLRLLYHREPEMRIREMLDFARILYNKGLYLQSLANLAKAKELAQICHRMGLLYEIVEFEKMIETRHITRSPEGRAESLIAEAVQVRRIIDADGVWSDLAIQLYGLYLKVGHIRNKQDYDHIQQLIIERFPAENNRQLSFFGKVSRAQAQLWRHYILQEFTLCYRYANEWVGLFERYPDFKTMEPELYVKGLHNLLSVLFYCANTHKFVAAYRLLDDFVSQYQDQLDDNTHLQAYLFLQTARLNRYFLEAKLKEGALYVPQLDKWLQQNGNRLDKHRVLVFWYKMGSMLFSVGDHKGCIRYLQLIINHSSGSLREDVQCFARILSLISHYELGNDDLLVYHIRATYRFLLKMKDMQLFQQAILTFLRQYAYTDDASLKAAFAELLQQMEVIFQNRFERRPFLYLDIISWLKSKVEGRMLKDVIRERLNM